MQRALGRLEEQGLVYTQRTAGRFITEDVTVIKEAKEQLAAQQVTAFLAAMERLSYTKEEIRALIERAL